MDTATTNTVLRPSEDTMTARQKLVERQFTKTGEKTVIYRGRKCKKTTYEKNTDVGIAERIGLGATFVATALNPGTTGLCFDEEYREATIDKALKGPEKEIICEPVNESEAINVDVVGCDPTKSTSLIPFLKEKRSEWHEADGHNFLIGKGRKGISFFYFIPNGDVDKAYSVKFWQAKNGKSVMDYKKQLLAARSYCATFENVEKEWNEKIPLLANDLVARRKKKGITLTKEEAIAEIKNQNTSLVIDTRDGVARMYGPYDSNKINPDDYRTGTVLKLDKETIEEVERIHGKSKKYKEDLEGTRPFKKPANPFADLLGQGGEST